MSYKKELSFGLDIGDRSLKVLQFRVRKNKTYLEAFSELALPPGLIVDGEILKPDEVAISIKKILQQAHIGGENVITALPEAKTFIKILEIPKHKSIPLAKRVADELERHLPYELDQVWWDMAPIKEQETKTMVLTGAAPRDLVNSYTNLLSGLGLTLLLLDLEPLAIARAAISANKDTGCSLIADLGGSKSTLIVAVKDTVISTADARSSGSELTVLIAKNMKVEEKAAEEMKRKYGLTHTAADYSAVLKEYTDRLASRIQEIFSFSLTHEAFCPAVSQILLSGGGALLKGLPEALEKNLKIPVRIADPWINARDDIAGKIGKETGIRFVTAAGLALSALNYDHAG